MDRSLIPLFDSVLAPYSTMYQRPLDRWLGNSTFSTSNIHTGHTDTEYVYHFPLAGVSSPDAVDVQCHGKSLSVSAQTDFSTFQYSTTFPSDSDIDSAAITLEHGMLTARLPRRGSPSVRRLTVNSSVPTMNGHEVTVGDCSDGE